MQLREYLKENHLSITQFAKMIDFHEDYVSAVMRGLYKPGGKLVRRIETFTQGMVRKEEILTGNVIGDNNSTGINHEKNNRQKEKKSKKHEQFDFNG